MVTSILTGILLMTATDHGSAWGIVFLPKDDNEIIALDVATGRLLWAYRPRRLGSAHFELYKKGLVAYRSRSWTDRRKPIFLNPDNGRRIPRFRRKEKDLLARSPEFAPNPPVKLANGWYLDTDDPTNRETLLFCDPKNEVDPIWSIKTRWPVNSVCCWRNLVFLDRCYRYREAVVLAYKAGESRPTWQRDLSQIIKGRAEPLTFANLRMIGDELFVQSHGHVFSFQPSSGKLLWHLDLCQELKLKYKGDFFGGGFDHGMLAKAANTLIVAYECRIAAVDLSAKRCLWHLQPDSLPATQVPLLSGGKVFLVSGWKRELARAPTASE